MDDPETQVSEQSPQRILRKSIRRGLGDGRLGVVMSRAGVGKTACLVQFGIDAALTGTNVVHITVGQPLDEVQARYDALLEERMESAVDLDLQSARARVAKHRMLKVFAAPPLTLTRLQETLSTFSESIGFQPQVMLIDGFSWQGTDAEVAERLRGFKRQALDLKACVWVSAQTHRRVTGAHPDSLTPPVSDHAELVDVAIFLQPHGEFVNVRLLKDHELSSPSEAHLLCDAETMRVVEAFSSSQVPSLTPSAFTLLSGGNKGAESEFGECAERWGLAEINFSFRGRNVPRKRGLVELTTEELKQGDVSATYIKTQMKRSFPQTPGFRLILQTIWYQVRSTGEVFAVGKILDDGTVKGGTGWAVELARHWKRTAFVFDQDKKGWFRWDGNEWLPVREPVITRARFTGTGTRFLTDDGKKAIHELFERSFGPAPS